MITLELLAPARNLACGKAAIDHGADAVYIGADRFGARAEAGNAVADIAELCDYAHAFNARVFVTVNTIVYDSELEPTRQLLVSLRRAGADAVIVQDMAVLEMALELGLAVHASTQTDNRTAEKVKWLYANGAERVVLARELSVASIAAIHREVPGVELEAFVHGALCVSYSGLCYASQYCFHRSANRGDCAQFCRLPFTLEDSAGQVIERNRHLLSLKDMNRLDDLERLAGAGVVSFKIEGRLKDEFYVKNVTAAYSMQLTRLVRSYPDRYRRASLGRCTYSFTPDLYKTFNRGFTSYMLDGRRENVASFDTPKAMGQLVGTVKEMRGRSFTVAGVCSFANGDGLCFLDAQRQLVGFRVNRAEGNRLFPLKMPDGFRPGTPLYRNNDQAFERLLSRSSAIRKIPLVFTLSVTGDGYALTATADGDRLSAAATVAFAHEQAAQPPADYVTAQLSKLGGTRFVCEKVKMPSGFNGFIPASVLATLRRTAVANLELAIAQQAVRTPSCHLQSQVPTPPRDTAYERYPYLYNVSNSQARSFYRRQGLAVPPFACEQHLVPNGLLMQCGHCLRYALGHCLRRGGSVPRWKEPLYLSLADGRRFRLEFDCSRCQMNVYSVNI